MSVAGVCTFLVPEGGNMSSYGQVAVILSGVVTGTAVIVWHRLRSRARRYDMPGSDEIGE